MSEKELNENYLFGSLVVFLEYIIFIHKDVIF